jgi:UDP-GlcNAc:undecaprenyl-phosphate GlcNAc-1-phosphate transferase
VVIPTDTVYGIAADAFQPAAVERLLAAKGRGRQSPPPVLIPGIPTLEALAETVTDEVRRLTAEFWPGGLTVIVRARPTLEWDLGETRGTVALRMPSDKIALELLAETGPLAVSSANLTGEPAATTAAEAQGMLGDSVTVYLDGGPAGESYPGAGGEAAHRAPRCHPRRGDRSRGGGRAMRIVFYLVVAGAAAVVSFAFSFVIWKLSARFRLYPKIRERDVHTRPTPRLGGIAMFLGIVAAFLVASRLPQFEIVFSEPGRVLAILGAALMIVLLGVADDIWDLDWVTKLAGQILAAGLLAWQGVQLTTLPIPGRALAILPGFISLGLTILVIVLVMNAVNFIDGLDGLVAGVAIIANSAFFVYAYIISYQPAAQSDYFNLAQFISAVLIGVCAGFLPLNWHRARLFMGDAGALLVGMLMATSAIAITGQIDFATIDGPQRLLPAFSIAILIPFAILIVPLLDFGLAIFRRLRAGKSPFTADRKHLHHRLLDMGHSHLHAVLIFYAWTAVASFGSLLLLITEWWWAALVTGVGLIVCTIVTLAPLSRRKAVEVAVQSASPELAAEADVAQFDPLDAAAVGESEPSVVDAEDALERLHEKENT